MLTLDAADFVPASPPQPLAADEIHLWIFPQCPQAASAARLRGTLARYLETDAETLRIERGAHGKPHLPGSPLQFNLSHSGDAMLLALALEVPVGVDLEIHRHRRPWRDLARRFFAPEEAAALAALADDRLPQAFLDLWSAKEALVKALGRGIAFGLANSRFALDAHGRIEHLAGIDAAAGELAQWRVLHLRPLDGSHGALAWHGPVRTVRAFRA